MSGGKMRVGRASQVGAVLGLLVLAATMVPACGEGTAPDDASGAPGVTGGGANDGTGGRAAPEGGQGGEGGVGAPGGMGGEGTGGMVDPCALSDDACAVETTVYVAPRGDDDADGSLEAPVETVTQALELVAAAVEAGEEAPEIHVCAAEYAETLAIGPEHGAVSIWGAFDCDTFAPSDERALVQAQNQRGHRIEGASGVTLSDLVLKSRNASGAGTSSYGLWVVDSSDVRIVRSEISAAKGAAGADGAGFEPTNRAEAGVDGNPGTDACEAVSVDNPGGTEVQTSCGGVPTVSIGGAGGPGGATVATGGDGAVGQVDGGTAGAGEDADLCLPGGPGGPGTPGEHGTPSAALGQLSSAGLYVPLVGGDGTAGTVGEGGGGGGGAAKPSSCDTGASGGSGGGGGCPGAGALGGKGGGGSFGLMSLDSEIELVETSIVVVLGGQGGKGGDGQRGGAGADGGDRGELGLSDGNDACDGGNGGAGGRGGSGAGGAGGPSIAVVYTGTAPEGLGEATLTLPDDGADGGPAGTLNDAGQGLAGVVQASWAP